VGLTEQGLRLDVGAAGEARRFLFFADTMLSGWPARILGVKGGNMADLVPFEEIERRIFLIRGHRVMLDSDLAELYDVETKYLVRQVKRNLRRFPGDFMLCLTKDEFLRCQSGTSKKGGRRYLPYAFTEQGVAMLSGVLSSKRAIEVNIRIMRAFVRLRELLNTQKELARKLEELEKKYDAQFKSVFDAIKALMGPPAGTEEGPKTVRGFKPQA